MRNHICTAVVLSVLLVAGCKQGDSGPKSMEEAKAEAQKLDRPRPGQYKQTVSITQFEIPGAPPQAQEQLKQAMARQNEIDFCLTEEMAAKGFRDMFQEVGKNGECKYDRFDVSGGKLDAELNCEAPGKGKAHIVLSGKVTPEGSDVTVTVDQDHPTDPMGKAKIGMRMTSQRMGDCLAAK